MKFDKFEQDIENSFARGEWKSVRNLVAQKRRLSKIAKTTIKNNKTMNIRINEVDLNSLKAHAIEQGIPYQNLVTNILHKFVTGRLTEKRA